MERPLSDFEVGQEIVARAQARDDVGMTHGALATLTIEEPPAPPVAPDLGTPIEEPDMGGGEADMGDLAPIPDMGSPEAPAPVAPEQEGSEQGRARRRARGRLLDHTGRRARLRVRLDRGAVGAGRGGDVAEGERARTMPRAKKPPSGTQNTHPI